MQLSDRLHTNAEAQRVFLAMTPQEQMLEIWLNGRETNGEVARLRARADTIEPIVQRHDAIITRVAGVLIFIVGAAPFIFYGLDRIIGK